MEGIMKKKKKNSFQYVFEFQVKTGIFKSLGLIRAIQ